MKTAIPPYTKNKPQILSILTSHEIPRIQSVMLITDLTGQGVFSRQIPHKIALSHWTFTLHIRYCIEVLNCTSNKLKQ